MAILIRKPRFVDWFELVSYPITRILFSTFSGLIFMGIANLLKSPNTTVGNLVGVITPSDQIYHLALLSVTGITFILTVLWLGIENKQYSIKAFGLTKIDVDWKKIGKTILLGFALVALEILVFYLVKMLNIKILAYRKDSILETIVSNNFLLFLVFILVIGIIGPVIEEIFFRGILFGWFRRYFNPWLGIVISSTVFGLLHFRSILTITCAFLFGIALSWLYEHEKSLIYPIVLHMTFNIVVTAVNFYLPLI